MTQFRLAKRDGEYFLQYKISTYEFKKYPWWRLWAVRIGEKIESDWIDIPTTNLDEQRNENDTENN